MENNTIFDDVFRTMLEKMPQLVIPVINEVFHTCLLYTSGQNPQTLNAVVWKLRRQFLNTKRNLLRPDLIQMSY